MDGLANGVVVQVASRGVKRMPLSAGLQAQICKMARDDGLSCEQIAESLGLDVGLVAVALERGGRKGEEKGEGQRALEAHFESAVEALAELAIGAENEGVRAKAAMYLADVKLGLKKPREEVKMVGVVDINKLLEQAQKAYKEQLVRVKAIPAQETIDV